MKNSPPICLLLGALCGATVLSAHTPNGHEHKLLRFDRVVSTMTFAGNTTAEWRTSDEDKFTLTITQPAAPASAHDTDVAMSLFTLGIQGLANDSEVTVVAGDVRIKLNTEPGASWQPVNVGQTVLLRQVRAPRQITESDIGLIRFNGTECRLTVTSIRSHKGHTEWISQPKVNHDTTPPTAYAGGEN